MEFKHSLLIYSIKNTEVPLVRFDNDKIEFIVFAFFTRLDNDKVFFTLKCKSSDIQIEVEMNNKQQNFKIKNDERVKIFR